MNIWTKKVVIAIFVVANYIQNWVKAEPEVPCFFIFGDSLVDDGNNNQLPTSAKVNYPPYGIDFPNTTPTGRFTNGQTTVDLLGSLLGLDNFIPSFTTAKEPEILKGVNYASGSAGIREETGQQLGAHISLDRQLQNHQTIVSRIIVKLGSREAAKDHLSKCLYYVGMGSNDYINNYFKPQSPTSRLYTPEKYAEVLVQQYHNQIMGLYNNGARKVALFGVGLIGCIPYAISAFGTNGSACVDHINNAALLFNKQLIALVDQLNNNLTDAKFIYVNIFGISSGDPRSVGFTVLNVGCCPTNKVGQCTPLKTPCQNRSSYVFWDSFHPTEAVNQFTARRSYIAHLPSDTYPIDISHLVKLKL
ncbi:hypothetical protein UlMin_018771 [Ulmus minor]